MTITCENCNTRFVLDESRIPAQGARVRCSRCQHRFHVKPPPEPQSPDEIAERAVEDSAPFEPSGGREEPPEPPEAAAAPPQPEARDDHGALDNPEFLFDEPGASGAGSPPPPEEFEEVEPREDARERTFSRERLESPPEPPREQAPLAPVEPPRPQPPAAVAGTRALEGDIEVGPASSPREDLFGAPPDEGLAIANADETPLELAQPMRTATSIRGASGATMSASSAGVLLDIAPEPASKPAPWRGFAREVVPKEREAEAPRTESRKRAESEGASRGVVGWVVSATTSLAAFAVALSLLGGAARTLAFPFMRTPSAVVRGEGWLASDLDAFHARSADGRRVLVIRGTLVAEGSGAPPRVRALLLDGTGNAVGEPATALPQRLDGAELAPTALAARLASAPAQAPAGPVRGFTILVVEPPQAARRYRVELD